MVEGRGRGNRRDFTCDEGGDRSGGEVNGGMMGAVRLMGDTCSYSYLVKEGSGRIESSVCAALHRY